MGNGSSRNWDALWEAIEVEAALDAVAEGDMEEAGPNWAAIQKRRNMQRYGSEPGSGRASRGPMGPAPAGLQTPAERERDQADRERQASAHVAPPSVKAFFQGGPRARPGAGPQSAAPNPLLRPSGIEAPRIGGMTRPRPQAVRDDEVEDMPEAFTADMPMEPLDQPPDSIDDDMEFDVPMGGGEEDAMDGGDDVTIPRSLAQELVDFLAAHGVDEPEEMDDDGDMDIAGDDEDDDDEEMDELPPPPKKAGPGRPPGSKNKPKSGGEKKPEKKDKAKSDDDAEDDGDKDEKDEKDEAMTPVRAQSGASKTPPSYLPGVHSPTSPMRPGQSKGPPKLGMPPGSQTKGEAAGEMDEKHVGFKALSKSLSHEKGVQDPDALAASIGRKKLGSAEMARRSKAGRK